MNIKARIGAVIASAAVFVVGGVTHAFAAIDTAAATAVKDAIGNAKDTAMDVLPVALLASATIFVLGFAYRKGRALLGK